MRFFKAPLLVIFLSLLTVVAVATPASAKTPKLVPNLNGTITFTQSSGAPATWNPHTFAGGFSEWTFFSLLYDRLINISTTNQLEPMLATSWKFNANSTQLTFTLRKGVKFQDGSSFNADVAAANLQAAAAAGSNGQAALATMTSVVATGPYTVVLTFSEPNPGIIFSFTYFPGIMVSPNGLANPSKLATTPMGSGPYELSRVDSAQNYYFSRFNGYWDKTHKYTANLEGEYIVSETAVADALNTGTVDVAYLAPANLPSVTGNKSLKIATYDSPSAQGIFMNDTVPPLNNVNVREAVALALNRQAFDAADNGQCMPFEQAFIPGMVGYTKSLKPTTNVAKAKQLIQQAGATGASITMLAIPNLPYLTWAEVAQSQLDAVGLNVTLDITTGSTYRALFQNGGIGMLAASPTLTAPDPTIIVNQYVTGIGNPGTKDPILVAEIDSAEQLPLGSAARSSAFQQINIDLTQKYYLWTAYCIPVYSYPYQKNIINATTIPFAGQGNGFFGYLQVAK